MGITKEQFGKSLTRFKEYINNKGYLSKTDSIEFTEQSETDNDKLLSKINTTNNIGIIISSIKKILSNLSSKVTTLEEGNDLSSMFITKQFELTSDSIIIESTDKYIDISTINLNMNIDIEGYIPVSVIAYTCHYGNGNIIRETECNGIYDFSGKNYYVSLRVFQDSSPSTFTIAKLRLKILYIKSEYVDIIS